MIASSQNLKIGIYVRLSNDDEREGESLSIDNQKNMLKRYCDEKGYTDYSFYQDDGYTGTNFERPGVQKLLNDAQLKKINMILVKDLSRFGRNYILIGQYMDYIFPSIGCRFVALGDNVDTSTGTNDMAPIKNLFNEWHARDTGNKAKAVLRSCFLEGKFIGTYAPYGYQKDPENKHRFVVDSYAAEVVKKIFEYRTMGFGYTKIAGIINSQGYIAPRDYYYLNSSNIQSDTRQNCHRWNETGLKNMLNSEVYIGNMVQGKTATTSFKNKKLIHKSKEEWVKVENTHEPIIDIEIWQSVQAINSRNLRPRTNKENRTSLFSSLLVCEDCGYKLRRYTNSRINKKGELIEYSSFVCGSYARSGKTTCSIHSIKASQLEQIVLADIQGHVQEVILDEQAVRNKLLQEKSKQTLKDNEMEKTALKEAEKRSNQLERLVQALYEDKVLGSIPENTYRNLMEKYQIEQEAKTHLVKTLTAKIRDGQKDYDDIDAYISKIKKYVQIEKLDREMLLTLIKEITVGEVKIENGQKTQNVGIYYNYLA